MLLVFSLLFSNLACYHPILIHYYKNTSKEDLEKEGKVVISNEEYENLKKQVKELEEQRDEQAYITEDLIQEKHLWTEQARKATAREILTMAIQLSDLCQSSYEFQNRLFDFVTTHYGIEVETKTIIPEKYGVDLGEK